MPTPTMPEYAFIGRSNVGKSSLINMLTMRNGLAKTSGRPGKTITVNHFLINNAWYLVDLPGYGYAKRARTEREKWKQMMYRYLLDRPNLIYTFILVDVRVAPQNSDLELMEWMAEKQLPFVVVFTKTDKLGGAALSSAVAAYKKQLLQKWEELPLMILTSSENRKGREEILQLIEEENRQFDLYSNSIKI
jgi:GTP-binding protein